jgi:hypothetical protein
MDRPGRISGRDWPPEPGASRVEPFDLPTRESEPAMVATYFFSGGWCFFRW